MVFFSLSLFLGCTSLLRHYVTFLMRMGFLISGVRYTEFVTTSFYEFVVYGVSDQDYGRLGDDDIRGSLNAVREKYSFLP
jgi:hypothetical protein